MRSLTRLPPRRTVLRSADITSQSRGDLVYLDHDGWTLTLAPTRGGAILDCAFEGMPVLRPSAENWMSDPDLFQAGHFPLAPYSNRIGNGTFEFGGQIRQIARNKSGQRYPIHGTVWQKSWNIGSMAPDHIALTVSQDKEPKFWPWTFDCTHEIRIHGNKLHFSLSLTNTDDQPIPAGLGFHPYLANMQGSELQFEAETIWMSDGTKLPAWEAPADGQWDFSAARPVKDLQIDHCYSGAKFPCVVSWPSQGRKLTIQASDNMTHAVICIDPETDSFCVEPVTHMNNALNWMDKHIKTGMQILAPVDTLSGEMILSIETI